MLPSPSAPPLASEILRWLDQRYELLVSSGLPVAPPASWLPTHAPLLSFLASAHEGQTRLGTRLPYITHLLDVTLISTAATHEDPKLRAILLQQACLSHDCLEDTDAGALALSRYVAPEPMQWVGALTKDAALPKEQRMEDSLRRVLLLARECACAKLCDRISNTFDGPPPEWKQKKREAYALESETLASRLGHASPLLGSFLLNRLDQMYRPALAQRAPKP